MTGSGLLYAGRVGYEPGNGTTREPVTPAMFPSVQNPAIRHPLPPPFCSSLSLSFSLFLALDLRNTIRSVSVLLRLRIGRRENVRPGRLSVRSDICSRDCEQIIPCIQFVQRGECNAKDNHESNSLIESCLIRG